MSGDATIKGARLALTRDALLSGEIQRLASRLPGYVMLSDAELAQSLAQTLAARPGPEVWVFAYGSLMWNPAFEYETCRVGHLVGWHRSYCLWTHLGRGTPDQPGLMLALERGGSCSGLAFRIAAEAVEQELTILWRREMIGGAYRPRWVRLRTEEGMVSAIAYTINRAHPRYTGDLDEGAIVPVLASAAGALGSCRDYLAATVERLGALGLSDRKLARLHRAVEALVKARPLPPAGAEGCG